MVKKDLELIKGIVNEVVTENNKVLLAKMESMEKQIKALSVVDKAPSPVKVVSKPSTTKSAKSTKSVKVTKAQAGVQVIEYPLATDLGYDVVEYNDVFYIRQTTFQKDRKYRELAMKNDGRLMKDSKMKCYEFKTFYEVEKALKAIKKSKDAYKKSVAK